ncbi:hypothetical protein OO010_00515 [Flavobacteriaceae bacterium KMM 6898]|nr:hypothetical protein [Flavobacteriaceae bacterium KMM 6898]
MYKNILKLSLLLLCVNIHAQKPITKVERTSNPSVSEMQKQMEEAMKDMDPDEKAEFQKMMKGMMPAMTEPAAAMFMYADFETNAQLVPKKDMARIAAIPKQKVTAATISTYASNLYAKIMAKGEPQEIALIKSVLTKALTASDLNNAAILAMAQGHPQTAMALSMKAVQKDPINVNFQNNMAALLSQYGYEEQAIPVLNKLVKELPDNSTVLNNLGQAWFGLGELDSAKTPIYRAIAINPSQAEALLCGGLIDELQGDPIKAEAEYVKAIEKGPLPVIQKVLKNKAGKKGSDKIDFEKLKNSITIYDYFPKDWIFIPDLSDHLSGFELDQSIQNGYAKMFEDLDAKLEQVLEATSIDVQALANKGEEEFVSTMMLENTKGVNKMSLTATTVLSVLNTYMVQWQQQFAKDDQALKNEIQSASDRIKKPGKDDKCPDIDGKNSSFLAYSNPKIREFYAKKIEEFRVWLNAYCTWSWYVTGNPKNTIIMSCLGWTTNLKTLYESAILEQVSDSKCGYKTIEPSLKSINTPEIPNFSCPTIVQVPIGKDWQQLTNATKNFDKNSLGIKSNPSKAVPNHSVSFTAGKSTIAESGIAPSVSTSAGSISSNVTDAEVNAATDRGLSQQLQKLIDSQKSKALKELLKKMMSTDCDKVKSPNEKSNEEIMKLFNKELNRLSEENDVREGDTQIQKEINKSEKLKKSISDMEKASNAMMESEEALDNIKQNGIQSTINTSVQVPGNIQPQKGLFNN